MAWRIDESVVRGEIDNREKGMIRGRLWMAGRPEPVVLELKGNACADLAGCHVKFESLIEPQPNPQLKEISAVQRGTAGDMTASRKVRVYDVPLAEVHAMIERGEKPPEHMANSLYLEWFSEESGRVVIESADYRIEISPPVWKLTKEDEAERAKNAEAGWTSFAQQLGDAIEAQRHDRPEDIEAWDEFDFEKSLRESDALTDKYLELLDKYGDSPESEDLIAKEMGWNREDDDQRSESDGFDVDEINRICQETADTELEPDPATEGVDWIRVNKDGIADVRHPLQHRCFESAMWLWHTCDELGLSKSDDESLSQLITEFQITGAKLAGALNGLACGRDTHEGAFVVACLKRALDHLHKSQAGLEAVVPKQILPVEVVSKTRRELFEIREEILRLMEEFRRA